MNDLGGALRKARKAKGITLAELGSIVGTDTGNLSRIETGRQGASQHMLESICDALGMSLSGFITAHVMRSNVGNAGASYNSVPVIALDKVESWISEMEKFKEEQADRWLACPVEHGPRTFAMVVMGESMHSPTSKRSFSDGDYIFCDPDVKPVNGSLVIADIPCGTQPVFRQLVIEGDSRYLQAINPSWPSRIVKIPDDCKIHGSVIFKGEVL